MEYFAISRFFYGLDVSGRSTQLPRPAARDTFGCEVYRLLNSVYGWPIQLFFTVRIPVFFPLFRSERSTGAFVFHAPQVKSGTSMELDRCVTDQ